MTYSLEELDSKIVDAQARFDDIKAKKDAADASSAEYDQEIYRLQGEYRVLNQMRDLAQQAEQAQPDPALVVEAKPKDKK